MKSNGKRSILICVAVAAIFALVVSSFLIRMIQRMNDHIPDENGEDRSLCHLTDADIESCRQDSNVTMLGITSEGEGASGLKGRDAEDDNTYCRLSFGKFSGIYVANAYRGDGGSVTYTVKSDVIAGNFRIVVTDAQNKILHDIPIDQEAEFSFRTTDNATYYLKLVGESAKVKLELWRK